MRFMLNMPGGWGMNGRAEGRSVAATQLFYFVIATFADFTGECRGRRA